MKRARIRAMVTVPTRRKTTQDITANDVATVIEHSEKHKDMSNHVSTTVQQLPQTNLQENETQEIVQDTYDNDHKVQAMLNSEDLGEAIHQQEKLITTRSIPSPKATQNRLSFMRPMPKFANDGRVRRNSIQGSGASASESEDDNKKVTTTDNNHIKNDIVQSVQNTKDPTVNSIKSNLIISKVGQKRRIPVSESARKLAEARKEFQLKHENKTPDRSKLTMYDLIYYNPITNPMKKPECSTQAPKKRLKSQSDEFQEEENEDDPSSHTIPVPQVKVGPNGQLIIDEQSLVIEQTNVKKNREVLAKEAIIDDDNSGGGFYKKRQKSKEWSKYETLRFYQALNTVGTDFLLMQTVFPKRTRQEIKLKFKKEERINRDLVEKVLTYHQEFDTETLEKSLATFDSIQREHSIIQEKHKQQRTRTKRSMKWHRRQRSNRIVATSIAEMNATDNEDENDSRVIVLTEKNEKCQQILHRRDKKTCKNIKVEKDLSDRSLNEIDDVESVNSNNGFDSDTEVYRVRPTRSGRLPKVKKLQGPDVNTLEYETINSCPNNEEIVLTPEINAEVSEGEIPNNAKIHSEIQHTHSVIPNIYDVEPGSLVILSKESPEEPGKSVLQVFMVSSDVNSEDHQKSNITPVNISPELLATVTAKLSDVESVPVIEEHE